MSFENLQKNDKVKDYIIEKQIEEKAYGTTFLAKKMKSSIYFNKHVLIVQATEGKKKLVIILKIS